MGKNQLLVALCVIYAVAMAGVVGAAVTGFAAVDAIAGPVMVGFSVVSVFYGVRAARHPALDRPARRAARVLVAALALALATPLVFLATGPLLFPAPGDAFHLGFTLTLFAAVQLMPLRRATRRERWKTVLDAGIVVAGATMALWYLIIGPALADGEHSARLILAAAAYPVVDLLVLFGFARVLLRGTSHASRRALWLLGSGVLFLFAGDVYLGYTEAQAGVVQRTPWQFACWLSMHLMLACGAYEQWRQAGRTAFESGTERRGVASRLPYAGIALGFALMAVAALHERTAFPWLGLVLGGIGSTALVVLRQLLAQQESTEAAETDALTGLANRARLHHELTRLLNRPTRHSHGVAVLLIDLDGFKQVNDTLGHQAGDGLLVAVAQAMRSCVRPDDLVGRLGGDEFAVVVQPSGPGPDASAVAQRILDAIAGPFIVGGVPMSAAASIGVATAEAEPLSADALLHRADLAMYDAKRNGGGRRTWHPDLEPAAPSRSAMEAELMTAVEDGALRLTYAPIVALRSTDIVGAEALLSWDRPRTGPVAPAVFLPVAERIGLLEPITRWMLTEAARRLATQDDGRYVLLTLPGPVRPQLVREVLAVPRPDLVLEVPEAVAGEIRALGVRVAVRDFGTGPPQLTRRPGDLLRLDGLTAIPDPAVAAALVRLGQALGLTILADGVEIPATAADVDPARLL